MRLPGVCLEKTFLNRFSLSMASRKALRGLDMVLVILRTTGSPRAVGGYCWQKISDAYGGCMEIVMAGKLGFSIGN